MLVRQAFFSLVILALAACQSEPAPSLYQTWSYADLRALDAADAGKTGLDLLAAYTRRIGEEWQVRLDLLDLDPATNFDLYLAFDTGPGGDAALPLDGAADFEWDTLVVIPAAGDIQVFAAGKAQTFKPRPVSGLRVRVLRDPLLDTLEISLNQAALFRQAGALPVGRGPGFELQVFTTQPGKTTIADSLGPLRSDGPPPPPAQVLYTFWNTLPAYTPAQTLRRWDGAHTGPAGGRHGLYNLLRAVRNTRTPVVLLDLVQPAMLSALDTVGGLSLVRSLSESGLLILPQVLPGFSPGAQPAPLPGWAIARASSQSRRAALDFGLPASPFLFAPQGLEQVGSANLPSRLAPASLVFVPNPANSAQTSQFSTGRVARWKTLKVVTVGRYGDPDGPVEQASLAGPSIEMRRRLVQAALETQKDEGRILVLGGNLPASAWGDPPMARFTLQYLAAHPWVRALNADDLLSLPASQAAGPAQTSLPAPGPDRQLLDDRLLADLENAPANSLGQAAWQAYLALLAPAFPTPAELPALRAAYLGQVGVLLAGARWAENPEAFEACDQDLDWDGQPECVLASEELFLVFELRGGSLAYAFVRDPDGGVHQWVGPSSQLSAGLSEPSSWDPAGGLRADPDVLPGAFFETTSSSGPPQDFQAELQPGRLALSSADGSLVKTFQLEPSGLQVTYHAQRLLHTRLVFMLDPWLRFSPDWTDIYQAHTIPGGWSWGITPPQGAARRAQISSAALRVEVRTESAWTASTFKDSLPLLDVPENPNLDYPGGHFLPFPLASLEFLIQGDFSTRLILIRN